MKNFLYSVCEDIYAKHKANFKDTLVVFPNKQAGTSFTRHLAKIVKDTVWSPKITTLNEFVSELSKTQKDDSLSLIFRLYNIYIRHVTTDESFDDFYYWGEMLLNDFNDIDKYFIDAQDLFKNLCSLEEIDSQLNYLTEEQIKAIKMFWKSFNVKKHSKSQQDFLKIWDKLYNIYNDFKEELKKENLCYEGMAYREIVEQIKNKNLHITYKKILFVGFNALNKCEELLFLYLSQNSIANFYWDYDSFYTNNPYNEAGFYMHKNLKNFPNDLVETNFNIFLKNNKDIEFISVSSDIGQAKAISDDLRKITKEKYEKTAIVLADENLLVPVLHSIPENINKINVTMGYPAQNSTIAGFIKHIIDLQSSARQDNNNMFYFKPLISILNHQYINCKEANKDIETILKYNKIYVSGESLQAKENITGLFSCPTSGLEASIYLINILQEIFRKIEIIEEQTDIVKIEKEYLYHLFLSIKRLNSILEEKHIKLNTKIFYKIISKLVKNLSVPFKGEPLEGLQIMGIMETRLLDFENIYILSTNEGKLPKNNASSSYIPYNLRKGFGLPTMEHQDAVFAYHFYRLIQRAKNIKLLYSTRTDGIRTGEMSRFLYQLKYESGLKIKEVSLTNEIAVEESKPISYIKDDNIYKILRNLTSQKERPLSPSAINEYLTCKLRFYFKYILKLKEEEELTEEIDHRTFGNIFHDCMENIYKPHHTSIISSSIIDNILKDNIIIDQKLHSAFKKHFFKTEQFKITGRISVVFDLIKKYIIQVLKIDKGLCPFNILATEERFAFPININFNNNPLNIYIGGSIDRVDKTSEGIRILDYKTGTVKLDFKNIDTLFDIDSNLHNKAVLQTLIYCQMYDSKFSPSENIIPGIYSLREVFSRNFDYKLICKPERSKNIPINDYRDYKDTLLKGLKTILEELFDKNIPFNQTENSKTCSNCPYADICHR